MQTARRCGWRHKQPLWSNRKRTLRHGKHLNALTSVDQTTAPTDEARKVFHFRHFVVYHDRCAMKIGTDAMLLGSWTTPPRPPSPSPGYTPRILDVGTGTGVLALMMAQKTATGATAAAASATPPAPDTAATGAITARSSAPRYLRDHPNPNLGLHVHEGRSSSSVHGGGGGGGGGGGAARIVAIDVDPDACAQAAENAALSPWRDRIRVVHCSLQQLASATAPPAAAATGTNAHATEAGAAPTGLQSSELRFDPGDLRGLFDLIISNPPYFLESSKPAPGRAARASSRHADVSLPFPDLAAGCAALLAPGGSLCVVLPPTESQQFVSAAAAYGLALVELVRVFTAPEDRRERRHLMRLQRAADLPCSNGSETDAASTPLPPSLAVRTSTLVINGPKQPPPLPPPSRQQQQQQARDGASAEADWQASAEGAARAAATTRRRRATAYSGGGGCRHYTDAYLALTADFHHPDFFRSRRPAQPSQPL